jgi:hypothetical protein
MSPLLFWVLLYALETAFAAWIIKGGGAERLEGTVTSGFLISIFAPRWTANGIRIFVWLTWGLSTLAFGIGLFSPEFRSAMLQV